MRTFSVDEARRLVPLLTETFTNVRQWLVRVQALKGAVAQREELIKRIRQEVERLMEMGIEVKSLDGLVDFRALRDGRQVYLCWRFGETTIDHWHELQTGFAGRRPIEDAERFAPTYLS